MALPLGRGNVFNENSKVSAELKLMVLKYLAAAICLSVGGLAGLAGRVQGCNGEELFVCVAIRCTTCNISSSVYRENSTRCSVWQVTQPPSANFCSWVPGMLMSHSALESCLATFEAAVSLLSFKSS